MDKIGLVGIPFDKKSSFMQGAAQAPGRIRETLHNGSGNYWTEKTVNPIENPQYCDLGDLAISQYFDIESKVRNILQSDTKTLCLGGDHSIAYPIVKAQSSVFREFDILQIDAHSDMYDIFEGDRYSHACPFARIMEENLSSRLVQVGIRTLTPGHRQQAERYNVEVVEMKNFHARVKDLKFNRPLYISLDMDGFDPAYAPGVSHPEPGGLSSRDVLDLLHRIEVPVIGADIVEYNPYRDVSGITAALAAKMVKEIAGLMLS